MTDFESPIRVGSDLHDDDDAVFAPPAPSELEGKSPFEQLQAVLATNADKEPVRLKVPTRPGVSVLFRCNMTSDERKAWQKRATSTKRGKDEVDEMFFSTLVLANTCLGVFVEGQAALDDEGTPLTFAHKQLWDMVKARDPREAIRAFYGNDAHVLLSSGEVLLSSGYDDDIEAESGPTSAS